MQYLNGGAILLNSLHPPQVLHSVYLLKGKYAVKRQLHIAMSQYERTTLHN